MDNVDAMKKELILKNSIVLSFATAIFATVATILLAGIGFLMDYTINLKGEHNDTTLVLIVFACIIAFIWLVFLICTLFSSKIIIDDNEIKAKRFGKIIWSFKKEEILVCIYNELHWWIFLAPIAGINAGALQFKMQSGKISRHSCSLSQKQVDKIKANFDYPFREIQTIYEQ